MAELKTRPAKASPLEFLESIENDERRRDGETLLKMMEKATGATPTMWGPAIVGFGDFHYKYDSGREGDWFMVGFSPRKQYLAIYLMAGIHRYKASLEKLGKHSTGKGCLYIKRLADVDRKILDALIRQSVRDLSAMVRERKEQGSR
jgi:hypothetical protein